MPPTTAKMIARYKILADKSTPARKSASNNMQKNYASLLDISPYPSSDKSKSPVEKSVLSQSPTKLNGNIFKPLSPKGRPEILMQSSSPIKNERLNTNID